MEGSVEGCWHRCQYNIKMYLKDVGYEGGNWIQLAQHKVQRSSLSPFWLHER